MARHCTKCGKALPKDDARFCNNCGALVASRSPTSPKGDVHPRQKSARPASSSPGSRSVLREQIATQPGPRPTRLVSPDEIPTRRVRRDRQTEADRKGTTSEAGREHPTRETSKRGDQSQPSAVVSPTAPVSETLPKEKQPQSSSVQVDRPKPMPPAPELQVKVWEQEDPVNPVLPENVPLQQEQTVKDLPTRPLAVPPPEPSQQWSTPSVPTRSPIRSIQQRDQIEHLDTIPAVTAVQTNASDSTTPSPTGHQHSFMVEMQQERAALPPSVFTPIPPARHRRRLLLIIAVVLCLVVVGGVGAWLVEFQPFSVPAITQPQQSFQDAPLGLSLLYPTGWTTQLDRAKATVHFSDSSHTAEVIITVKPANTSDMAQYLRQQAAQQGMTGVKAGSPLSFAGATWQVVQGSTRRSGANYTEAIVATVHAGHLFTLLQLAPQSIYAQEEQLVFSAMRSSLQFM